MSNAVGSDNTPIVSEQQLVDHLAAGCKPAAQFRIGTEHEKFVVSRATHAAARYEGPSGIAEVLARLRGDGTPIVDAGHTVGVIQRDGAAISLEPAGQLELSGAPLDTLHDTHAELHAHLAAARAACDPLGLRCVPLGFHPHLSRDALPWMPKQRYAIMRRYMPRVGTRGLDMMQRTCTVQVNLDFASESDMARKLRASLALQPIATALFANSPFVDGRPSGLLSTRADTWLDTDADRCGVPALFLSRSFGFERYVSWLLDNVPMYFVRRGDRYADATGHTFRDFLRRRIPHLEGEMPTLGDFADHLTTVFTEVRLKRYLEMRGADAGSPAMMVALSALWTGLLYDPAALSEAATLAAEIDRGTLLVLRRDVPRTGLDTPAGGRSLRAMAADALAIAHRGLRARARKDAAGRDESMYLAPLDDIVAGAPTQAEHWLARYRDAWAGDATRIHDEAAI
ncbi:glutamate--cysteine ligase [Burkholderia sp. AU42008]|uniref:glutamate--cysteine ligase n=1 Tax=unclassified Burkholderia TaxID=2613784 RepID=UPI000B7A6CC3|nr:MULTISPECIES: glutamate--cysteine ligase [unclassified Burkholderia]MBR8234368.1 glutamate--cysteine ligase [Burkholderia sp. AU32357]MBY4874270.1 glutamate--cysteine ligase [Burkholderia sp. AU42008]OXI45163.1 glutamate--cysteine ligase [Burkholderia sp. AU17457]